MKSAFQAMRNKLWPQNDSKCEKSNEKAEVCTKSEEISNSTPEKTEDTKDTVKLRKFRWTKRKTDQDAYKTDEKENVAERRASPMGAIGGILRRSMHGVRFSDGSSEFDQLKESGDKTDQSPRRRMSAFPGKSSPRRPLSVMSYVRKSTHHQKSKLAENHLDFINIESLNQRERLDTGDKELPKSKETSSKEAAKDTGNAMSIGSDLNDESVKENQDSNGNEKEQQVTAAIVNEKVERSSVKAASASTTVELNMDDIPLPVARLDNKAAYDKMAVRPKTRKAARKARGKPQHIHISTSQVNGFSGSFTTQQEHTSEDEELKETSPKAKRSRPPILSISEDPQEHTPNEEAPAPKRYSMLGRPPGGPTMVVPSLADVQMIKLKKTPTFGDEKKPEQSCDNSNARVARSLTSPSASPSETQKKTKSDIFSKPKILRKKSSKTTKTESVMSDTTTTKTERVKVKGETVPKKLASMSPVKKRKERNNKNQVKAKDPNSPSGFKGFSYFERVKEEKKKAKKELETEKNQSGNNSKPADEESTKPENKSKDVLADKKTTVDKEDINTGGKQTKERLSRKATVPEPSKVMNESIDKDKAIDNQRKDFEKKNVAIKHIVEVESKALTENSTKAEVRLAEKPIPKPRRILSPKHEDNKNIAKSILKMGVDVLEQENGSTLKHGECVSKEDKNHDHTDPVQYTREIVRTEEFTEPDETTVSDVLNKDMQEPKPAVETNVKSSKKVAPFANEGGRKKDEDVDTQETIQSPSKTYFSIKPLRETGIPQSEMSQINHTFVMRQVSLEKKDSEIKHQPEHKAISETPLTKVKKSEKNQNIHIVQEKDKNMDNIEQAKAPTEFNIQDHTIGPHKKSDSFESDFTQVKLKQAGSQNQKMVSMKKPAPNSHEKGNSEVPKPVDPVSSLSPVETAISIFGERRNKSVKLSSAKQTPTRSQRTRSFNIDSEKETPGDNIHKTKESTGPLKTPENLEALIIHSDTRIDDQNNNILKSGKSNITGQRKNSLTERKETIMTDTPESRPRSKTEISSTKPNEVSSKPSWVGLARRRSKLWEEKSLKPVKPLPGDHTTSKTDSENDLKRPESLSITSSLVTGKSESPQMAVKEREDTIVNNPTQRLTPLTPSAVLCPNRKNSIPDINGQQSKRQQASPTKSLKESQPGKPAWLAIAMQKQKRWTKEEAI